MLSEQRKTRGKARLIPYALRACRWYLIAFHILFGLWAILVFASLMYDPAIRDYCIYAEDNEPYDFIWGEETRCRIDWSFFYGGIFPSIAISYCIFSGPVWILKFLLEWKKRGFQADEKY